MPCNKMKSKKHTICLLNLVSADSVLALSIDSAMVLDLIFLFLLSGAVVPITNTRNVVATLVHLAYNVLTLAKVHQMSCKALAMISLSLQTLEGQFWYCSGGYLKDSVAYPQNYWMAKMGLTN